MLTFNNLRRFRLDTGMTRGTLALLSGLPDQQLKKLEGREVEPYWDEYVAMHKVFAEYIATHQRAYDGVLLALTGRRDLNDCIPRIGLPRGFSRSGWIAGARLPLSATVDLCLDLGLSDPIELNVQRLHRQLWDIVGLSERNPEGAGWCPWCGCDVLNGQEHHHHCLPNNLWGLRGKNPAAAAEMRRVFVAQTKGKLVNRSMPGYGLRRLREARGLNQSELAQALGLGSQSAISAIENLKRPLSSRFAAILAAYFRCDESELYLKDYSEGETSAQ